MTDPRWSTAIMKRAKRERPSIEVVFTTEGFELRLYTPQAAAPVKLGCGTREILHRALDALLDATAADQTAAASRGISRPV